MIDAVEDIIKQRSRRGNNGDNERYLDIFFNFQHRNRNIRQFNG